MGSTIYQRGEAAGQRKTKADDLLRDAKPGLLPLVPYSDQELLTRLGEVLPKPEAAEEEEAE